MKKVDELELDCESSKNLVHNQHVRIRNNHSMLGFPFCFFLFQFLRGGIPNSKLDHSVCSKKLP